MARILLDCERMKYANTGLFEFCKHLGGALIRNKMASEEVGFYVFNKQKGYFGNEYQYIVHNPLHRLFIPPYRNIDVWHSTYQITPYKPTSRHTKRVITIHDLNFIYENKPAHKVKKYLKKVQRNIDSSDHIVTISHFVMDDLKKHLQIDHKPASVVMNGCNMEVYPDYDNPVYRPQKPFLFTIGSVIAKKNFHVLPCLLKGNDYELLIAGPVFDESYKQKVIEEAKLHGVLDRVHILGPISTQDKYWYMNNCSAFLFPSIAEGFGLPVIEAMRLGKPCFISDRTSLPEVGGTLSYYFRDFDPVQMQQVFTSGMQDFLVRQPIDAIIQHGRSFTLDGTAQGYLQVYRSLY